MRESFKALALSLSFYSLMLFKVQLESLRLRERVTNRSELKRQIVLVVDFPFLFLAKFGRQTESETETDFERRILTRLKVTRRKASRVTREPQSERAKSICSNSNQTRIVCEYPLAIIQFKFKSITFARSLDSGTADLPHWKNSNSKQTFSVVAVICEHF